MRDFDKIIREADEREGIPLKRTIAKVKYLNLVFYGYLLRLLSIAIAIITAWLGYRHYVSKGPWIAGLIGVGAGIIAGFSAYGLWLICFQQLRKRIFRDYPAPPPGFVS